MELKSLTFEIQEFPGESLIFTKNLGVSRSVAILIKKEKEFQIEKTLLFLEKKIKYACSASTRKRY